MTDNKDPSANVLNLVKNNTEYLEKFIRLNNENVMELIKLQVEVSQRERAVESNRVNANRADDRKAVDLATEKASKQAELLANQMLENAENVRTTMENKAILVAEQTQQATNQITNRLKELENTKWEKQGSSGISSKLQIVIATALGSVITGIIILMIQGLAV